MLRAIVANHWAALALGVAAVVLHIRWSTVDKTASGKAMSSFDVALSQVPK